MVYTLRPSFEYLEQIRGKNVVVCFGTTGCGKSTMLNSLLYGKDNMGYRKLINEIKDKNGKVIKKTQKRVMDLKEGVDIKGFKVGHSNSTSETFIPGIRVDPDESKNLVWMDIAGFEDSNGPLMAFIIQFMNKKIFHTAKTIKVMIVTTVGEAEMNRGQGFRKQL